MKNVFFKTLLFAAVIAIAPMWQNAYASVMATATKTSYYINDEYADVRSYTIEGSNYVNLRDIAQALSYTSKKFAVGYNASKQMVVIERGKQYQYTGMEGGSYELTNAVAFESNSSVEIKGSLGTKTVHMSAYNIDGFSYFKLRDIASALDFQIYWTENKQIPFRIETDLKYDESTSHFDGKYVYLKSVNAPKKRLAFDEIEWVTMFDTERIAQLKIKEEDMIYGYMIYNPEETIEVYPIEDNCSFYYIYMDGANGVAGAKGKLQDFPKRQDYDVCMIGITNGKVTWVSQVHRMY